MIKFRLWDLNMKKYFPQYLVNELTLNKINSGAFIVEQFTGLKDKNGKEIYVGDICKNIVATHKTDEKLNRYILGEIVFANLVGKFMLKTTDNNHYDFREIQTNVKLEVIGNINKNKELLE